MHSEHNIFIQFEVFVGGGTLACVPAALPKDVLRFGTLVEGEGESQRTTLYRMQSGLQETHVATVRMKGQGGSEIQLLESTTDRWHGVQPDHEKGELVIFREHGYRSGREDYLRISHVVC
jgi:hypothetical protein